MIQFCCQYFFAKVDPPSTIIHNEKQINCPTHENGRVAIVLGSGGWSNIWHAVQDFAFLAHTLKLAKAGAFKEFGNKFVIVPSRGFNLIYDNSKWFGSYNSSKPERVTGFSYAWIYEVKDWSRMERFAKSMFELER